jgi:hypothetical protein
MDPPTAAHPTHTSNHKRLTRNRIHLLQALLPKPKHVNEQLQQQWVCLVDPSLQKNRFTY